MLPAFAVSLDLCDRCTLILPDEIRPETKTEVVRREYENLPQRQMNWLDGLEVPQQTR